MITRRERDLFAHLARLAVKRQGLRLYAVCNGLRLAGAGRIDEGFVRRTRLRATRRRDVVESHAVRTQHKEVIAHDSVQAVVPVLEARHPLRALAPGENVKWKV